MAGGGRRWWGRYERDVINEKLRDERGRESKGPRDDQDDEMQRNQLWFLC